MNKYFNPIHMNSGLNLTALKSSLQRPAGSALLWLTLAAPCLTASCRATGLTWGRSTSR